MERIRDVQKISSIFDILNNKGICSKNKCSIRIMFEYDKINRVNEFTVLDRNLPKETTEKITSWLEKNVRPEDVIYGMESNKYYVANVL